MRGRDPLVIHYVHDMERAKTFYTETLDVRPSFESPGWTTLDLGAIQLALHILHAESEPSAGEREGLAPRMEEPSAGEREGLAPRMEEPSAGEREGLAPRMEQPEGPLPHAGLNLLVDSIEEVQRDIERLGGRLIELREPGGGVPVRVASFVDCEGNGFELRQEP